MEREAVRRSLHAYFHKRCHAQGEVWIHRIWRQGSPLPPWQSFSFFRRRPSPVSWQDLDQAQNSILSLCFLPFHPSPVIKHQSEGTVELIALLYFQKLKVTLQKLVLWGVQRDRTGASCPARQDFWCLKSFMTWWKFQPQCLDFDFAHTAVKQREEWSELSCLHWQKCPSRNGSFRFEVWEW